MTEPQAPPESQPADLDDVLRRVAELPISTWNYIADEQSVRHLGPMAQDFKAAFGLGDDDRKIYNVDAQGVALAAIKALLTRLTAVEAELRALKAEVGS